MSRTALYLVPLFLGTFVHHHCCATPVPPINTTTPTLVPISQSIPLNLDGQQVQFLVVQGERLDHALQRACSDLNICHDHGQYVLQTAIVRHSVVDNVLMNHCGRWTSGTNDNNKKLYIPSNLASFFAPLFPHHTSVDFQFPVLKDDWVSDVIDACGVWEPGLTLLMALALSPLNQPHTQSPELFVDVGSHLGWYSLVASKICGVSRVLSFECHPGTAYQNMQSLMFNQVDHIVKISTAGISDAKAGHVYIPFAARTNRGGLFVTSPATDRSYASAITPGSFSVPSTSLDALQLPHVRIMKVDVNGHDVKFVKGAEHLIVSQKVDYMLLEMGDLTAKSNRIEVIEFLNNHGYIVVCLDQKRLGVETGVFVERVQGGEGGINRAGRLMDCFMEELENMLPGFCNPRMEVGVGVHGGAKVVRICDPSSQQPMVLEYCYNTFVARSETLLASVVDLAKSLPRASKT